MEETLTIIEGLQNLHDDLIKIENSFPTKLDEELDESTGLVNPIPTKSESIEDKADTLTDQEFKKSQGTEVEFTDEAKYILETRYKVEQQRDLSDDEDIESEIAITQEINLWQLKQKLGLGQQGNNNLEEESTTNSAHYKNLPNLGNGSLIEEGHYIFIGGQTVLCFFCEVSVCI
ncbi:MAG: hypothetical protein EBS19_08925 [Spirochaetia bacterium]|nr:hypothetical protein [Spirochaetia bacterium]